ncbi:hypothetical protein ACE7GA_18425 [Roseomonas sp. CCTCC AB2023176]|uniref:hypothetical protein n=1 Tax=Roseomonas sp. CCTCC AB2023176 TaxID=3342640 RepID=UPI0035D7515A
MSTPLPVLVHLGFSLAALAAVPVAIGARRLGISHRIAGRVAAGALFGAALSALALTTHGFTPLHVLALIMMATLGWAVWRVRHGRVEAHRRSMLICAGSLVIAGVAAVAVPGRLLHAWTF